MRKMGTFFFTYFASKIAVGTSHEWLLNRQSLQSSSSGGQLPSRSGACEEMRAYAVAVLAVTSPTQVRCARPFPTSLPTSTTSIYYLGQGYTGHLPTQVGLLTAVSSFNVGENTREFTTACSLFCSRFRPLPCTLLVHGTWTTNQPTNQSINQPTNQSTNQPTNHHRSFSYNCTHARAPRDVVTGTCPTQLGMMTAMAANFSPYSNRFTGPLPSELGSMTQV
jgi:hypothetical protein